jgi:thiamine-phosphate pyrophosphorylase
MNKSTFDLSLYLVTDSRNTSDEEFDRIVESAVQGGVTLVQLREKTCSSRKFYEKALRLKRILSCYQVPLIINDRLDIALAVDAEGLHIGQSDLPYSVARKLLGPDKIIGLSVETLEDVKLANSLDIDYIGVSPVFSTPTKTDTAAAVGLDGSAAINQLSVHPSVGIGGINKENVASVIESGCAGVSLVSAIMSAVNPASAASELKEIILKLKRIL